MAQKFIYWRHNKQSAIRSGKWKLVNRIEIYDLEKDISEKLNLAAKYPEIVKTLQQKFEAIDNKVNRAGGK